MYLLEEQLLNYDPEYSEEKIYKQRILEFLKTHANPFSLAELVGHITASAFLLNSARDAFLLMHHTKLDRWLQPGGHCDGNPIVLETALREAEEETGLTGITVISEEIFDIEKYKNHSI